MARLSWEKVSKYAMKSTNGRWSISCAIAHGRKIYTLWERLGEPLHEVEQRGKFDEPGQAMRVANSLEGDTDGV